MKRQYTVILTTDQREQVRSIIRAGKHAAETIRHAHILLQADRGPDGPAWTDVAIASAFDVGASTVGRICKRFAQEGVDAALYRRKSTLAALRKLDGEAEAQLVLLACSPAPDGRATWSYRLLGDRLVQMHIVDSISHMTVARTLKKTT